MSVTSQGFTVKTKCFLFQFIWQYTQRDVVVIVDHWFTTVPFKSYFNEVVMISYQNRQCLKMFFLIRHIVKAGITAFIAMLQKYIQFYYTDPFNLI